MSEFIVEGSRVTNFRGQGVTLPNGFKILFLGHRGDGATDSTFHRQRDFFQERARQVENTLASQRKVMLLDGADGIELDAIASSQGTVFVTHADEVKQHVLIEDYELPQKYIGRMKDYQIREIPVGISGKGRIPLLADTLTMFQTEFPNTWINIELKGKVGNTEDQFNQIPSFVSSVIKTIDNIQYPFHQLIFSSFSHRYLLELASIMTTSNRVNEVKLGILYDVTTEDANDMSFPLCRDPQEFLDYYLPLSIATLEKTYTALPMLYSIHAEVSSITEETLQWIYDHHLHIYVWALQEASPPPITPLTSMQELLSYPIIEKYLHFIELAQKIGFSEVGIITDDVAIVKVAIVYAYTVQSK
jgi:glycerophosphoryl diester phosphodiesterase